MIETRGLTKRYGSLEAVVDLNLSIEAGEIFGFIGPNGAGKTTTMRILATLLEPTRGVAKIDGLNVQHQGSKVRRIIGYMPDFMGVYDDLKVYEYLEFFAAAFGIPASKRRAVIEGVLELTDLTEKKAALVDSLSRGMQQRLQLARVLVHDPKVLILDEPASGLDPRARIEIRELLRELGNMGKTIMVSSHILSELAELCTRFGIIEKGHLLFQGTFEDIRKKLDVHGRVRVQVAERIEEAEEVLKKVPVIENVERDGDSLLVILNDGEETEGVVAETLVRGGFKVKAIVPEELKLDDAFLKLTRGEVA